MNDIRNRILDVGDQIADAGNRIARPEGTRAFLGKVVNGGSKPTGQGRIYLVNPVQLDGTETEGGTATITADTARQIPVLLFDATPAVGDYLICHSVGGRWIARNPFPLHLCQPQVPSCNNARYSANGTVTDSINGTNDLVWDYAASAWFSDWLPYTSSNVLQSGPGSNPCTVGSGTSYYFHKLEIDSGTGKPKATLVLPGQSCVDSGTSLLTAAFFKYSGGSYPGLLGRPASWSSSSFTPQFTGDPTDCDPLDFTATWPTTGTVGPYLPMADAVYSVPKFAYTDHGFTCGTPCPLPRKDLTLSWTHTSGPGSGTLVYDPIARTWAMACNGDITATLAMTPMLTTDFRIRLYPSAGCTGTPSLFAYGTNISMTGYTCEPLWLEFEPAFVLQALYVAGYRSFAVSE